MENSSPISLTPEQTYACAFRFLQLHYEDTRSDYLNTILSGMQLLEDGQSADPAEPAIWNEALDDVLACKVDVGLRLRPAGEHQNP